MREFSSQLNQQNIPRKPNHARINPDGEEKSSNNRIQQTIRSLPFVLMSATPDSRDDRTVPGQCRETDGSLNCFPPRMPLEHPKTSLLLRKYVEGWWRANAVDEQEAAADAPAIRESEATHHTRRNPNSSHEQ